MQAALSCADFCTGSWGNIIENRRERTSMMEFKSKYDGLTEEEIGKALRTDVDAALRQRYGTEADAKLIKRVEDEWAAMLHCDALLDTATLYEITSWLRENRSPFWACGCTGAGFIHYLLEISRGNPLPPHSYCPKCHRVDWDAYIFRDGFDLPELSCEHDGTPLTIDGHDIPYQTLWGYEKDSYHHEIRVDKGIRNALDGVLDQHWMKSFGFTPWQNKQCSFLIDFSNITIVLEPLKVASSFYDVEVSADSAKDLALPKYKKLIGSAVKEWDCNKLRTIPSPLTFEDLLADYGLVHSAGVWDKKARLLVKELGYFPSDMIAFCDDVFQYLLHHGFSEEEAWQGMNECRRGRGLPKVTDEMVLGRDRWVIDRCEAIEYLLPKAHGVEYILFRIKGDPPWV